MTIDRPGHGLSDFQPERTLLDWPEDVAALADHLEIRTIPDASLTVLPDERHFLVLKHRGGIIRQLTDAPGR